MKKLRLVALAFALVLALALPAMAEQVDVYENSQLVKSVVFRIGVAKYVVNDETIVKMDVAPFIESDRTFVPVRFLGNALGVTDSNITWDNNTKTATLQGNATLSMTIGQARITSDGETKAIDVAPLLRSDRTFLPARFVAEGLGYQVDWDEATQTVVCWPAGQEKPDVSAAVEYLTQFVEQQPQQPVQQPVKGNKVNGYVVPANTDLHVSTTGYNYKDSIVFSIDIKKGNLEQKYADAESILLQTLDADTTAKAIDYAKQVEYAIKNISRENPIYCPTATFTSPSGMAVRVGGGGGDSVQFDVWQTKK